MAFSFKNMFGSDDEIDFDGAEEEFYLKSDNNEDDLNGNKMILIEPRAYSESQTIIHSKKRNMSIKILKSYIRSKQLLTF